jgi:hypothetical protein
MSQDSAIYPFLRPLLLQMADADFAALDGDTAVACASDVAANLAL